MEMLKTIRTMKMLNMQRVTRVLLTTGMVIGLGAGAAYAQSAGQDMKDAGHDTKNAAVDTGHATKTTTKKAYRKTKHGTTKAYHKTVHGTKKAAVATGHRTENVGDAIAGKPEQH
jgi:hypothetical protein